MPPHLFRATATDSLGMYLLDAICYTASEVGTFLSDCIARFGVGTVVTVRAEYQR